MRDDRNKRLMVDHHPILEPVKEAFEEGELHPNIMVQPITSSRPVEVGEGSNAQKKKKKKRLTVKVFEQSKQERRPITTYDMCGKARLIRLGSFNWKMKDCEPISDKQLRWITIPNQITHLERRNRIGQGSFGTIYIVGFRNVGLRIELGMEGVVPYVTKKCIEMPHMSAWVMMHKKLASFAETHCAIVRPVASPVASHNINSILMYLYWSGKDIHHWINLEQITRGKILRDSFGRLEILITDHPNPT
ncbi:hypothetical protein R1sor_006601 [Riccia sorocarpa]|uniref:Protein kinase domain-containing protein n=1 Tax=Riccia sorocarpa TaxID=122646 RepID=A0ABD3HRR1_9MARC